MKKLILICGLLVSGFSSGADWTYATSTGNESFWVDKSFYKYDGNAKTVDVWSKSIKKKLYSNDFYTSSKTLYRFSCPLKKVKQLAYVEYKEDGDTLKSTTKPEPNFNIIFPDSIGEGIWEVACKTNGKGFKFTKQQLETLPADRILKREYVDLNELKQEHNQSRFLTPEEVSRIFPNGHH